MTQIMQYYRVFKDLYNLSNFMKALYSMVEGEGFEPSYSYENRFTVCLTDKLEPLLCNEANEFVSPLLKSMTLT